MARDPLEYAMKKTVRFTFKTAETVLKESIKLGASLAVFALKETAKGVMSLTKWGAKKVAEKKLKRERVAQVPMSYFEQKDREIEQEQVLKKEEAKEETVEPKKKKRRYVVNRENDSKPKRFVFQKETPEAEQINTPEVEFVEIEEVTPEEVAQRKGKPRVVEPIIIGEEPKEKPKSTILDDEPSLEELKNLLKEALRKEIKEEVRGEVLKEMEEGKNKEKENEVQQEEPKKEVEAEKEKPKKEKPEKEVEAEKEKPKKEKPEKEQEVQKEQTPKIHPEVAKKKQDLERLIKLINQNLKGTKVLEGGLKEEVQIGLMESLDASMKELENINKQIKLEALAQKEKEKEKENKKEQAKNKEETTVKKPKDEKPYGEIHSEDKIKEEEAFKTQFESTYEEKKEKHPEFFASREKRLNELAGLKENESEPTVKALYEKEEALLRDDVSSSAYFATEANVKNEEAKHNFQKGLVEAVNFGDVDTFKKEYQGQFDVVASDIAKYNYLLKEAEKGGNETEQNYWKDRIAETARDNIEVLREEILPLKDNENVDAAKYYAYENMIVIGETKEKHKALGVQEAKEFGDNIVEFAKEYTKVAKEINKQTSNQKEQQSELG